VELPYDVSVASQENRPASGCFDCSFDLPTATQGKALPAEMLPDKIDYAGVSFRLAPAITGRFNAVTTDGQTIHLPAGQFNRLYLLAAAANGDQKGEFKVGEKSVDLNVQDWTGFVGQWDDRTWKTAEEPIPQRGGAPPQGSRPQFRLNEYGEMIGIRPGYIKRADIGWFASHRHDSAASNEPYAYSYLFAYAIDVPSGAPTLTLPRNRNIRILAVTAANQNPRARPAQPLYDVLEPAENRTPE
jgi:alpha-mannosidase